MGFGWGAVDKKIRFYFCVFMFLGEKRGQVFIFDSLLAKARIAIWLDHCEFNIRGHCIMSQIVAMSGRLFIKMMLIEVHFYKFFSIS